MKAMPQLDDSSTVPTCAFDINYSAYLVVHARLLEDCHLWRLVQGGLDSEVAPLCGVEALHSRRQAEDQEFRMASKCLEQMRGSKA